MIINLKLHSIHSFLLSSCNFFSRIIYRLKTKAFSPPRIKHISTSSRISLPGHCLYILRVLSRFFCGKIWGKDIRGLGEIYVGKGRIAILYLTSTFVLLHSHPSPPTPPTLSLILFFSPSSSPASSFAFNMPSILQRHPRYSLLSGFLLLATFLLLASQHAPPPPALTINAGGQESLDERLDRAESIYQRVLRDRQGLIERFGPTPDKVMM